MAAESVIGRKAEQQRLARITSSKEAELVAVYGRRRVGKTYLIRQFFATQTYFEVTGEKGQAATVQLARFSREVARVFYQGRPLLAAATWRDAFEQLSIAVEDHAQRFPKKAIAVFLDELPWLASHRSGLIEALDHAWNARLSKVVSLRLIVCGSAAAWMLDKLVHAKGGLYNRVTQRIELRPFTLFEASEFLRSRGVKLTRRQTALLYMIVGGVPHYLKQVRPGRSVPQTIAELYFEREGLLLDEFQNVFRSLFETSDAHVAIVRELAARRSGLSQQQLVSALGGYGGGRLKSHLRELEASGFIAAFSAFGQQKKNTQYRLIDEYCHFFLRWVEPAPASTFRGNGEKYWLSKSKSPAFYAWSGYAFENLCFKHIDSLLSALGLSNVATRASAWRYAPRETAARPKASKAARSRDALSPQGVQVDLLLDRDDDTITLCEMKYTDEPFTIDRKYARELEDKLALFQRVTRTKKNVQLALVCAGGLKPSAYSNDLITNSVSLDAFFA